MLEQFFASEAIQEALEILKNEFPLAVWETFYITLLATAFAIILGLAAGSFAGGRGKERSIAFA